MTESDAESGEAKQATDDPTIDTPMKAWTDLADNKGQGYILAEDAHRIVAFLGRILKMDEAEAADPESFTFDSELTYEAGRHVATASDMAIRQRGFLRVQPYEAVITRADLSELLCEDYAGVEAAPDNQYAGAGFSADAAHEGNIERLRKALPAWVTDPEEGYPEVDEA